MVQRMRRKGDNDGADIVAIGEFGEPPTDGVKSSALALPSSTGATSNVVPLLFSVSETRVGAAPGVVGFEALT